MFEILNLKPDSFGLDISDLSLKIAKFKKKKNYLSLVSFGEKNIAKGIIEEGEVKDEKALTEIIKNFVTEVNGEKLRTKYVVMSLPEEKAFLHVMQMPKMEFEELKSAVMFESENYIPLPMEDIYLDFQIIEPMMDHLDHFDILIAALPKSTVDPYISAVKKAGLQPIALEIESLSISRALVKNEISPTPLLLIDLGETRTSFIIFSGYSLRFTSSIPVSSLKFTELISRSLKIELAEAEKLKIAYGLTTDETPQGQELFEAMIPVLTDLKEQIRVHIDYYHSHALHQHLPEGVSTIGKIILSGGGGNLKGLPEFLASELKIPVEIGNPWINILPSPLQEVPPLSFYSSLGYTTALGLALRSIKEKSSYITK